MHKLAVKLEGIERRKRTTGLLHIAAGCFLLLKSFDLLRLQRVVHTETLIWLAAGLISLLYGVLKKFVDPLARRNRWVRLLQVVAFTMLAIGFGSYAKSFSVVVLFAWAIGCLLLMFTERKVFQDAEMSFGTEGIFIPGYFTNRRLFWSGIQAVVVRPDFITIFKKDETFLQYEVLKNMSASVLDKIALFCQQQIEQAGKAA